MPIEVYRDNGDSDGDVRGMWEEFYQNDMYNSDLLLNSPYVDLIFLDTGRSEKTEIAKIHKAAKTFAMSGVDKSIWCYDEGETDADNAIWQAYKAYSELCPGMVTASQWIKYSDAEPSPCGGYFLINEKNEIVMYGWDDISMMYPVDYIRLNAIKKAVAPTNIEVTNMQGEVTFSWVMADENNTGVAYRVDSDGTVDSSGSHYDFSYDGKKITYVVKTGAAGDEDNYICRYQFAELDKYYVESEKSKTVSNEGMECPRDPELIKDAKLVQVENKTESEISDTEGIEISQGETAGIKVKLEKYSGEYEEVQASQDFDWYITDSEGEIIESDEPIKYWVDDLLDMTHIYVKGISLTGENTYYLNCDYYYQDKSYYEDISVPIKV